ncbi:glycoside hydrolase family 13 protein [Clostridium gasigenes]|uniref:glycoside hydrolase family 13 protein n=1 Tax=Clostridium gasigenes TaxID=94869 RepID=UPI001629BD26|nr:glycoside hydrolase family 13 protein [Clostridium gasigenes]MBB6625627.1 glycoside hydrolase family 13 protein [Clostridium gasigenes]
MTDIRIFHDSHSLEYRVPFGAVKVLENISLKIALDKSASVYINLSYFDGRKEELEMTMLDKSISDNYIFDIDLETISSVGIINYYFKIVYESNNIYYGNNKESLGGIGCVYDRDPIPYQITIYNERKVPSWYKEGIIYQIFVDRFYNGNDNGRVNNPRKNSFIYATWEDDPMYVKDKSGDIAKWDFFGGNLRGVIKKLEYIKSLGVSIIYMNPIFEAVSCHKYDTSDYEVIDKMFGTNEEFKELCEEAKKLEIRVILDGVFSHTGSDSKYFNKYGNYPEIGAYESKESKYYSWYTFDEYPHKYDCWWGFDNQPNTQELNDSYSNYIIKNEESIIAKWIKLGASGWRLDVADELPDKFIAMIKEKMLSVDFESVLIGEVWEDASNKVSYSSRREYFSGKELDSVTNYPLRDIIIQFLIGNIESKYFIRRLMSLYENYPSENFYSCMNLLGNHDTERIFTMLGQNIYLFKLAIVMQMTLPGVPLIYYGDEAGLTGRKDPENRKAFPWNKINEEVFIIYKTLGNLRNEEEVLRKGEFKIIDTLQEILIYERNYKDKKIIIIINPKNKEFTYEFKDGYRIIREFQNNKWVTLTNKTNFNICIKGYEFKICEIV